MSDIVGTLLTGERIISTAREQLPDLVVDWVVIKADETNDGAEYVYIGGPAVVKLAAADNLITGFQLGPGDETPKLAVRNLNQIWAVTNTGTPGLTFIAMR